MNDNGELTEKAKAVWPFPVHNGEDLSKYRELPDHKRIKSSSPDDFDDFPDATY